MNTSKVKPLVLATGMEPVPAVVQQLEILLAGAREGRVRAIAFAYVKNGYMGSYGWKGTNDPMALNAVHSALNTCAVSMAHEIDKSTTEAKDDAPA